MGRSTSIASNSTIAMEKGAVRSTPVNAEWRRPRAGGGPMSGLVPKNRRVALLDVGHQRHHAGRVIGQELDLRERRAASPVLQVPVHGALSAHVHPELLQPRPCA